MDWWPGPLSPHLCALPADGYCSYILDFELYKESTEEDGWDDKLFLDWDLAWVIEGDKNDTSAWQL